MQRLGRLLTARYGVGELLVCYLPQARGASKLGVDDYLVMGHTIDDLVQLARTELLPLPDELGGKGKLYRESEAGLEWYDRDSDHPRWRWLCISQRTSSQTSYVMMAQSARTRWRSRPRLGTRSRSPSP